MKTTILDRIDLSAAREWFAEACRISRRHSSRSVAALAAYGDSGPLISGIVREHFPEKVKANLRALALGVTQASDNAYAARPSRVRMSTMRALSRAVAKRDGSGFYGPQA